MESLYESASLNPYLFEWSILQLCGLTFLSSILLTDTTERSPTFGLPPLKISMREIVRPVLAIFYCLSSRFSLGVASGSSRAPRALEWTELKGKASLNRLLGFDLSESGPILTNLRGPRDHQSIFHFLGDGHGQVEIRFNKKSILLSLPGHPMLQTIVLKMLVNAHSTIVMGRLGRYANNVMTYVRPSNYKLIDRAIRYVEYLVQDMRPRPSYDEIAKILFAKKHLTQVRSIVEEVARSF